MASKGTNGADVFRGTILADEVFGFAGNDTVGGSPGGDTIDGGLDRDTVDYAAFILPLGAVAIVGSAVDVDLQRAVQFGGLAEGDVLIDVENVNGTGGDDVLRGDAEDNELCGYGGEDILQGRGGNDILRGDNLASATTVGVNADDHLDGGAGDDELFGNGGNDTLVGGLDNDALFGSIGGDVLIGGAGDDHLDGGSGVDTASYATSAVAVRVIVAVAGNWIALSDDGTDTLLNIENLTGSAFSDELFGSAADNVLSGGNGNDLLSGLGGDDTLDGGAGADTASYAASSAGVIVNLSLGLGGAGGNSGIDTLISVENVIGSAFADTLIGSTGSNVLDGGAGSDTLQGGAGNDSFLFSTALNAATNVDAISDFNVASDTIRLENAVFAGLGVGTLVANQFVIGPAAQDADDRIVYDNTTGALLFDSDGPGGAAAVQFADVSAGLAITNLDFLVV